MDEGKPKKHKDLIEPGSKEHQEATKALYWALDEVNRKIKNRYHRQKEAAQMERERKIREGWPLGDDCYFAQFTEGMHVRDEDLRDLWEKDTVAVRLTESGADSVASRRGNLDPKDYSGIEKLMGSDLLKLSEKGGYVWFENRSGRRAKVGVVRPGTRIEDIEACWAEIKSPEHKGKAGTATTLRTLRLEKVRAVHLVEATMLRASRPVVPDHAQRSLWRWDPVCGKSRLISLIDKDKNKSLEAKWNDLPPHLQVTVCTDFLRYHNNPAYPNIKWLLLTPTTMNSKDIDIYGMAEDGTEIMAQTPFRRAREKEGNEAHKKIEQLRKYSATGAKLLCFIPGFMRDEEDADQGSKLFEDQSPMMQDGVVLIPVQEVLDWVEDQPTYSDRLFPA